LLSFYSYHFALNTPFRTAKGAFSYRDGVFLVFEVNNKNYIGEISPLPEFSDHTLDACLRYLSANSTKIRNEIRNKIQWLTSYYDKSLTELPDLEKYFSELNRVINPPNKSHPKSIVFAIDCILLQHLCYLFESSDVDRISEQKTKSDLEFNTESRVHHFNSHEIREYADTNFYGIQHTLHLVPVNVTTNDLDQINHFYKQGYSVFKIKIGMNSDSEREFVKQIRSSFPDITLRLDANASWSFEEAITELKYYSAYNIEYIEQPVSPSNLILHGNKLKELGIPIAADESVRSAFDAKTLINSSAVDVLIVKPAMIGSISDLLVIRNIANTQNVKLILTTSLDAGPGRQLTALVTALFFNNGFAHGLATGYMFADDVYTDEHLTKEGYYHLNMPDFSDLKQITDHPFIKILSL